MTLYIDRLWKCMEEFKIPKKLINTCTTCTRQEMLLEQNEQSSFFENKTGLKKGDSLSPILFNLALQK